MTFKFEWDARKAASNRKKHGVSFDEALSVLGDRLQLLIHDGPHSVGEERYLVIGKSASQRVLLVVYTERGASVRIITARKASARERYQYEENR